MSDVQGTGTTDSNPGEQQQQAGGNAGQPNAQTTQAPGTQPPAEVDYKFEMPEGVELNQQMADEFKAIAKEANLSPDAANKVAALYAKQVQASQEAYVKLAEQWQQAVQNDKDIGGEKLQENLGKVREMLDKFGPGLREELGATPYGNHPGLIKFLVNVSKAMSEDGFQRGAPKAASNETDLARALYPSMKN